MFGMPLVASGPRDALSRPVDLAPTRERHNNPSIEGDCDGHTCTAEKASGK